MLIKIIVSKKSLKFNTRFIIKCTYRSKKRFLYDFYTKYVENVDGIVKLKIHKIVVI